MQKGASSPKYLGNSSFVTETSPFRQEETFLHITTDSNVIREEEESSRVYWKILSLGKCPVSSVLASAFMLLSTFCSPESNVYHLCMRNMFVWCSFTWVAKLMFAFSCIFDCNYFSNNGASGEKEYLLTLVEIFWTGMILAARVLVNDDLLVVLIL